MVNEVCNVIYRSRWLTQHGQKLIVFKLVSLKLVFKTWAGSYFLATSPYLPGCRLITLMVFQREHVLNQVMSTLFSPKVWGFSWWAPIYQLSMIARKHPVHSCWESATARMEGKCVATNTNSSEICEWFARARSHVEKEFFQLGHISSSTSYAQSEWIEVFVIRSDTNCISWVTSVFSLKYQIFIWILFDQFFEIIVIWNVNVVICILIISESWILLLQSPAALCCLYRCA